MINNFFKSNLDMYFYFDSTKTYLFLYFKNVFEKKYFFIYLLQINIL